MPDRPAFAMAYSGYLATTQIRKTLAPYGLKPAHGGVLLLLCDRGAISQQALAETLGADPTALVGVLNELERDVLTDRHRAPADRRRHIVQITTHGKNRAADIEAAIAAVDADL